MICPDCGFLNAADDRFCGSCQAYLEWDAEERAHRAAERPAGPDVPPVPPTVPATPTLPDGFAAGHPRVLPAAAAGGPDARVASEQGTVPRGGPGGGPGTADTRPPPGPAPPRGTAVPAHRAGAGALPGGPGAPEGAGRAGDVSQPGRTDGTPRSPAGPRPPEVPPKPDHPPPVAGATQVPAPRSPADSRYPAPGPYPGPPRTGGPGPVRPEATRRQAPPPVRPTAPPGIPLPDPAAQSGAEGPVVPPRPAHPPGPPQAGGTVRPRRPGDPVTTGSGGPDHRPEHEPVATAPAPVRHGERLAPPCPRCQASNPFDRTLCRRCGAVLTIRSAADRHQQLPWWRRVFRRDADRSLTVGSRPGQRRRRPRLLLPLILVLLLLAGWLAREQIADGFAALRDRISDPEALHPLEVGASSEHKDHPASAAFDGFHNRYWAPKVPGPGSGEHLEALFENPVRLHTLLVIPGSSVNQDEFLSQARPAALTVTLVDAEGDRTDHRIVLRDEPGQQTFEVSGRDIIGIRLTVDEAHGTAPDRHVAVAEVEFFGRR